MLWTKPGNATSRSGSLAVTRPICSCHLISACLCFTRFGLHAALEVMGVLGRTAVCSINTFPFAVLSMYSRPVCSCRS